MNSEPATIEPGDLEPGAGEPRAAEPEATEPEATEPVAPEPEIVKSGLSEFEFRESFFRFTDATEDEDKEDDEEEEEEERPESIEDEDPEFLKAKDYLLKNMMYDHLARVLIKIFDHRPRDAVDIFEALSVEAKKEVNTEEDDSYQPEIETQTTLAQIQKKIFKVPENESDLPEEEEPQVTNLMESNYYFEQAGVGLSREEMFKIYLAMKGLIAEKAVDGARFWGKIFGLEQNYIIVEADGGEGEAEDEEEEEEAEDEQEVAETEGEEGEEEDDFPLPKINYKPPPEVPVEESGTGTNRKVYYVCNDPGKLWTKLPNVTPKQITTAQKIIKLFTGRLDAPVISFPPFPGNEISYLRAQIARISAATQVCPLDYYTTGEEEEEETSGSIALNPDYEPPTMRELFNESLDAWVHHIDYILPQGRTTWWNPTVEVEEEEEEEEEEGREQPRIEPQVGPPILTPLSEDKSIRGLAPWTVELPSIVSPDESVVAIHSNLWVGAHAVFTGETFENIYVGWGIKNSMQGYNPPMPTFLASEYAFGMDLVEINDPTVEEEFPKEEEEEEKEEEDEEDEEDEDDDDEGDDEDTDEN